MTPQCGHTGPFGHWTRSRYSRAFSGFWKWGWFRWEAISSPFVYGLNPPPFAWVCQVHNVAFARRVTSIVNSRLRASLEAASLGSDDSHRPVVRARTAI